MKNKKSATLSILFLISLQFLIGLTYFNLNNREENEVNGINLEVSDIIVGEYTFPGVSGSIALGESIRIGLLDDLEDITGDHAWKGALLAAREINQAGGITINTTQYYVGLVAEDTDETNENLDISKGIDAANRIISYDPHFIIGGYRNESVSAYLEPIMDAKIPFLATGTAADQFCENVNNSYSRYKYFFRAMPMNSTSIGTAFLYYIGYLCINLGTFYGGTLNKVAILREDLAWTEGLSTALNDYLIGWGISVVQEIAFPIGATGANFNTYWDQIESAGVQLTIPLVSGPDAITMAQTYRNIKPKCLLAGINTLSQLDTYWDDTEGACQYEILMQAVHRTDKTSLTVPFWDSFVSTYNIDPLYTGVGSYDAVRLLVNASDSINSFNSDDIVSELEGFNQSNPFIGVSGNISFTNSHDLLTGYPYTYTLFCQWQLDGNKVVVPSYVTSSSNPGYYPSSLATGPVSVPYWGINDLVQTQNLPGNFTLFSNADSPDKDGTFNLTWSSSDGADNYSIFIYDKNIQYISKRSALSSYEDVTSSFNISGLMDGDYYYVVVAYNGTGETLSNNVYVKVSYPTGYEFLFDILLMVLIITIAIFGSIGAAIIVKKRISISGKKDKEISETKKEKIKIKLEEKLRYVDHLIKYNQIKLAYKNLGNVKDTADRYDFFAIFNQADKKVEICKDIEAGIYREVKREEPVMPVATEKAKEEKETIPVIEKRKEFKVFLSYFTLDSDRFQIDKIAKHLEKFTEIKKVYYYTKDSGQNIVEYMENTLSVCNIFVLFCTINSKKSKSVTGEWQSAYQLVKRDIMKIIPVYEDEDDVPILLIPMLNIRYDKEDFKGFINKLYQEFLR